MFNKRETSYKGDVISELNDFHEDLSSSKYAEDRGARSQNAGRHEAAIIGPSIRIDGDLHGDEDLIIDGEVKGTVHLKNNSLTIGNHGKVTADIYAHSIFVDGFMDGDLYGAEKISIRKNAKVRGNITSPRVSLEDGARFKGSIDMDPESDALKKAFSDIHTSSKSDAVAYSPPKSNMGKHSSASLEAVNSKPASGKSVESIDKENTA